MHQRQTQYLDLANPPSTRQTSRWRKRLTMSLRRIPLRTWLLKQMRLTSLLTSKSLSLTTQNLNFLIWYVKSIPQCIVSESTSTLSQWWHFYGLNRIIMEVLGQQLHYGNDVYMPFWLSGTQSWGNLAKSSLFRVWFLANGELIVT